MRAHRRSRERCRRPAPMPHTQRFPEETPWADAPSAPPSRRNHGSAIPKASESLRLASMGKRASGVTKNRRSSLPRDSATRGGFPLLSLGNRGTGPPDRKGRRGRGESPPEPRRPPLFNLDTTRRTLRHPRGPVQSSPRPAVRDAPGAHRPPVAAVARHPSGAVPGETVVAVCLTHGCHPPLRSGLVSTAAGGNPRGPPRPSDSRPARSLLCRLSHDPARPVAGAAWQPRRPHRRARAPVCRCPTGSHRGSTCWWYRISCRTVTGTDAEPSWTGDSSSNRS